VSALLPPASCSIEITGARLVIPADLTKGRRIIDA
jgi:hypothetical protein